MECKRLNKIIKIILGIFVLLFIVGLLGSGGDDSKSNQIQEPATASEATTEQKTGTTSNSDEPDKETAGASEDTSSSNEPNKEIVSTSFSDFTPYLDPDSTQLQKESFFDENFKGKYVTWSGTVSTVTESSGSYAVQVVHKSSTLVSDVRVEFRADQKDKLIQLKEGDPITYTAKMTRYGEILGMSAEDGVIDSTDDTETNSEISKPASPASNSDEPDKETAGASEDTSSSNEPNKEIVSTSFSDFTPYLDPDSTQLQKESFFDENFKGKYVTWSGTVSTVTESSGSYAVQVVHKSSTLVSDVRVEFRADQKDKLIQLKEGDPITYTAKMTRYGEILGMSAEDGVIE